MNRPLAATALVLALLSGACSRGPATGLARCPDPPDPTVLASLPDTPEQTGDPVLGEALFRRDCVRCHAPRIEARDSRLFRDYPRLDCDDYLAAAPDAYLHLAIAQGGPAVGRDKLMKPFAATLSPREIADVVGWLRASAAP